jgi:uncharacterized protein (DUF849 family)
MTPLLQAAIDGSRSPEEHPALPRTARDQAAAAAAAVDAGAGAVHLHVRNAGGHESLAAEDVSLLLAAARPMVSAPLGVSTGAWIVPDPAARLGAVHRWAACPDFASVNFHEAGAAALAACLLQRGVAIEAGLVDERAAHQLEASGLGPCCLRILLEPQEPNLAAALETVARIERVLDRAGLETRRLLHGTGHTTWLLLDEAVRRGYDARIGLEDGLLLLDGRPAADNAALVRAAIARARAIH